MSAIATGSSIEAQYARLLRTNLMAFNERCFIENNPGKKFVGGFHHQAMAHELERSIAGENPRFMASLPPRAGKTGLISVAFPAFLLGLNPGVRIIATTYAADFSQEITRAFQRIVTSTWYKALFPATRIVMNNQTELKTDRNGGRFSVGMGGALTGRGADYIIIDDIMKASETPSAAVRATVHRFFDETLYSRLDHKETGRIIISQQRLHQDDLIGRELDKGGWHYINFPAIAIEDEEIQLGRGQVHRRSAGDLLDPIRESQASLDESRRRMGTPSFQGQFQGQPSPPDGDMIKREWLPVWKRLPPREESRVTMSIDTAGNGNPSSDYSVCTVWWAHNGRHYLVDIMRKRLSYPDLRQAVIELYHRHMPDMTLIENKVLGLGLVDDLRRNWDMPIKAIDPKGDKQGRLSLVQNIFEDGRVLLPTEEYLSCVEEYRSEMLGFPSACKYDDQVDSTTQYLQYMRNGGTDFSVDWMRGAEPGGSGVYDPMDHAALLGGPRF